MKSVTGVVYVINNVYLCTRKSAYCAGFYAIKALKKSDLAPYGGSRVRFFLCVSVCVEQSSA